MSDVATKASIGVLTFFEPSDDFLDFLFGQLIIESGKTGEGPVSTGDFEMLGKVLSDRVEVFAVLEAEGVFEVLLSVEGRRMFLLLHG
jgi:hypothetical protein